MADVSICPLWANSDKRRDHLGRHGQGVWSECRCRASLRSLVDDVRSAHRRVHAL